MNDKPRKYRHATFAQNTVQATANHHNKLPGP